MSELHVVRDGPASAPPLLLIHGTGAAGSFWHPVVPVLAVAHHVIRVDLAGHGQSPSAADYAVGAQADRLARVLDDLGLTRVAVAGHSSGGYVATALAERRPDLVTSLALVSTGPSPGALLPQPAILRLLLAPPFGPLLWPLRTDRMLRDGISATCARPVELSADLVADLRAISYRTFRAVLRRHDAYLAERSVPDRLAALGLPVLVIFGDADRRWDPASVREYAAVPDARLEVLPGVGHVPLLEAPEAVGKLLDSAL